MSSFGERLRAERERRKWSLATMARASTVSRSYLYQLESGASSPSLVTLEKLAAALDLPIENLLGIERSKRYESGFAAGWAACRRTALTAMVAYAPQEEEG